MGKLSNPPSSELCLENLSVERSLLDLGLSPTGTLKRGGSDALENLHVEGESPSRNRCCLRRGFGECLGFWGNFAGGIGRFQVVSSPFPFPPLPPTRRALKGYRVTASDGDCVGG